MTTLIDVARRAGVATSTASRVLREDPNQRVSDETRRRIRQAAVDLRYRPNQAARALRRNRTEMLGLIQPGMFIPDAIEFHFQELARGAEAAAIAAGHWIIRVESGGSAGTIVNRTSPERELYHRLIDDGRVDGLIIASGFIEDEVILDLRGSGLPVVSANRRVRGVPSVVLDDEAAGRLAIEHLVGLGHRCIGIIEAPAFFDVGRRRAVGARAALRALDAKPVRIREVPLDSRSGAAATRRILARRHDLPTAIVVTSILHVTGVLDELRAAGLAVPGDMSVVTLPEHPILGHLPPGLTSVRTPLFEVGRHAAMLLMAMTDGAPGADIEVRDRMELVKRASTGAP